MQGNRRSDTLTDLNEEVYYDSTMAAKQSALYQGVDELSPVLDAVPPPLIHQKSPYATVPLPSCDESGDEGSMGTTQVVPVLHPALVYRRGPLRYVYDVRYPPPTPGSSHVLHEPAVFSPLPSLTLIIPNFPWVIIAHASVSWDGRPVVTVLDVLTALHYNLHLPARECVIGGLFHATPPAESSIEAGLERLEYLGGRRFLQGLTTSPMGPEFLTVHLA
ncbi:hypothetical protein ONZ45_g5425 [Pleurotus djamor]|nr:hypothetical protein ONZ45_g5425 [Pleurotus djamor]